MKCIACEIDWKTSKTWNTKSITDNESLSIEFCSNCGLGKTIFENSSILEETNKNQYDDLTNRINIYFNNLKNHISIRYLHSLKRIQEFNKKTKLLEVGSNIGFTLEIANTNGYEAFGCDINDNCRAFSELVFKNKIFKDFFDIDEKFDVIIMNDVLEHFPNPKFAIEKASEILNKDGVIFIQLPNIDAKNAKLHTGNWKYLLAPDHTFHFNINSLNELLAKSNFELIWTESVSAIEDLWPYKYLPNKILKLINNNPFYYPKFYSKKNGEILQAIFKKSDD